MKSSVRLFRTAPQGSSWLNICSLWASVKILDHHLLKNPVKHAISLCMAAYLDSYGARWHSPSYQAIICRLDNINIPESFGHRNVWDLHSCFPFLALFLLYALWLFLLRLFFLRVCWWSYSWVLACFKYRWPGESPPCVHICWISKEIGSSFHHDWSSRGMREFNCSARSKWTIWIFSFLFCSHN